MSENVYSNEKKGILLDSGTNEVEFLSFLIDTNPYAINITKICQLMAFNEKDLCYIPNLSTGVIGSIVFRGNCIPVIDLDIYFKGTKEVAPKNYLLVLEFNNTCVAIQITKALKILRISWEQFKSSTQHFHLLHTLSIVGTIHTNKDTTIPVLDMETLVGLLAPTEHKAGHDIIDDLEFDPELEKLNILYCEDSLTVQRLVSEKLGRAGVSNITICNNGKEALNLLESSTGSEFNLVLTDIEMPSMDGLTLCRNLRKRNGFQKLPVIFYSSTVTEQMKEKCFSVGGTDAFSKPELISLVNVLKKLAKNPGSINQTKVV